MKTWMLAVCCAFSLSACFSGMDSQAPLVHGWSQTQSAGAYTVQPGDTIYAIAWRLGLDYETLLRLNHLTEKTHLHVGQRLRVSGSKARERSSQKRSSVSQIATVKKPVSRPKKRAKVFQKTKYQTASSHASLSHHAWAWPAKGRLVSGFSAHNKGVNIAGKKGQPIRASAAGVVVYAGTGLSAYGKLLILKHNHRYLSAYAHNATLKVSEGEWVKQGQIIATMGRTGAKRVMLHFEIRKQGVPVDPMQYLKQTKR